MKVVIGIDPDSEKHGFALYVDGKINNIKSMSLVEINKFIMIEIADFDVVEVHMEDVCSVSASFMARDRNANINVKLKMAQHIGMCKQAQIELERLFDSYEIKVVKHKISKSWKDAKTGKAMFEKATGWKGRSNEDTRSAAYFGFLGCK